MDGDRYGGNALPGHHLRDEPAEGMADDSRLSLERAGGVNVVIGDLLEPLVGKDLRVLLGRLNGLRLIGPARREGRVALLFEQRTPAVPTGCEEPEAVHEDDRLQSRGVGAVGLLLFMGRKNCHVSYSFGCVGWVNRSDCPVHCFCIENPALSHALTQIPACSSAYS